MSIDVEIEGDFLILDDIDLLYEIVPPARQRKRYKARFNPFELNDKDFFQRYRFDKETATFIINLVNIEEAQSQRGLPISGSLQVLIVLRFLGRNVHQSDIADLHGISQPTVSRIISVIARKLALQLPNFIKFPSTSQEIQKAKTDFFQIAEFPGVIGTIDGTHVRIKSPAKIVGEVFAGHFINRKGYYSLNVQIVCDAQSKIIDIVARSRGSRHDARIWNECSLKEHLESTRHMQNGVLLGDAGYPLSYVMFTPIRNPETPQEERYNKCQILTRNKIECLNGQIKSKFRSIFERLRVDLDTAKNIVVATAVLHNIAKERNLSFFDDDEQDSSNLDDEEEALMLNIAEENEHQRRPLAARIFLRNFINNHFNHFV